MYTGACSIIVPNILSVGLIHSQNTKSVYIKVFLIVRIFWVDITVLLIV
jgi:hypothetical protein